MRRLAAVLLTLALIIGCLIFPSPPDVDAASPALPLKNTSEATLVDGPLPFDSPCGETASAVVATVAIGGSLYKLTLYQADGRAIRFLLVDLGVGDETPVWVGLYQQDGTLVLWGTYTYSEIQAKYPNICTFFTQREG